MGPARISVGYTFTPDSLKFLERLTIVLGCNKTQVLERLLKAACDVLDKDNTVIKIQESAQVLLESTPK